MISHGERSKPSEHALNNLVLKPLHCGDSADPNVVNVQFAIILVQLAVAHPMQAVPETWPEPHATASKDNAFGFHVRDISPIPDEVRQSRCAARVFRSEGKGPRFSWI